MANKILILILTCLTELWLTLVSHSSVKTLTRHADNKRLLPLAARQALDNRVQFLHETLFTVESHLGVGLVTQPLLTKNLSVGNLGGLATGC